MFVGLVAGVVMPPYPVSHNRSSVPADFSGEVPPPVTTVTVTDGLGRTTQLRKTAVVGGTAGMVTGGLVKRDALGRVIREYHPFFTQGLQDHLTI